MTPLLRVQNNQFFPDLLSMRKTHGYSLTELLVVLVIVMILMVASAPLFMKSNERARQSSRDLITGHLQRARSHAIATGASTAVLIPDYHPDHNLGGKLLGIAEVNWVATPDNHGGSYEVIQILQRWESLPGQMMVLPQSVTSHPRTTIMEQSLRATMTVSGKSLTGAIIVFSPTGQIISPATGAMELLLGHGTVHNGQITATETSGQRISYDTLQINRLTGRARQLDQL